MRHEVVAERRAIAGRGRRAVARWSAVTTAAVLASAFVAEGAVAAFGTAGQLQAQEVVSERSPAFLIAAASPSEAPKRVDIDRTPLLRRRITVVVHDVTAEEALRAVEREGGLEFAYSRTAAPRLGRRVSLDARRITVAAALTEILLDTGLDVVFARRGARAMLVARAGQTSDLVGTVAGRVMSKETGAPLVGAAVVVSLKDTTLRAVTGDSGGFVIANVPAGEQSMTARYIGYQWLTKKIVVRDGETVRVNFTLETRAVALQELVTTATGQQRRRDIGNAITTIKADSVLRTAPIRNLTDLLENRVPGMSLQHTTGAPGDPARIRLRGIGSVYRSNDPVVVVDGVRVYAAQTEERSGNLANLARDPASSGSPMYVGIGATTLASNSPAPSPLDQIDPNIIEKIEVLKGPSAATLYGADAANGVIVITTKRGKPGPTRWSANVVHGRTTPAGHYPDAYFRWGHLLFDNTPRFCMITERTCVQDSLVRYQALNDPATTVLGEGRRTATSLTASGGSQALTYSVTGTYTTETGLLKLPGFEVDRFRTNFNREAPDWMRRPHQYTTWSVTSNVTALLGRSADVTLTSSLERSEQQRSSLEEQLASLAGTYVDRVNGLYYQSSFGGYATNGTSTYLKDFYRRTTASALNFRSGFRSTWRPRSWLTATGDAGIHVIPRDDQVLLPTGLVPGSDSGVLIRGLGRSIMSTFDARADAVRPLGRGFALRTSAGVNYNNSSTGDVVTSATGLVPGTTTLTGAAHVGVNENRAKSSVFGWFVEPQLTGQRLSLSTGIRLDGGSTYGTRVSGLLSLPRLNGSWVISEEPWFPFHSLFSSLRLRGAYGQAQVQPGAANRLRLYSFTQGANPYIELASIGNTKLRPERGTELEGGVDADLLDSRLSVEFTAYRKKKVDALMPVALPTSVYGSGGNVLTNVGDILNTGMEVVVSATPVQIRAATWNLHVNYSRNDNTFIRLGDGVVPNPHAGLVAGYPVASRWSRPILGFADENGDGVLQRGEVQVGDSLVFMGRLQPNQEASLHSNLALFGGAIGVTAVFSYETGATQVNQGSSTAFYRGLFDASASFAEQAAVIGLLTNTTDYGRTQDISTFRFASLSVNYRAPDRVARLLGAEQLSIALQGSNLGMHTNYRGADPDVSGWGTGENIVDTGQLAQPRLWQLSFDIRF